MHWLLLLIILALATVAKAEKEVLKKEELNLLDNEDFVNDMVRMLEDLFEFSDADDEEKNEEMGITREFCAMEEAGDVEKKAVVDPEDQARYNKFIDIFFRRLNADARNTIDPLSVSLTPKKKKTGAPNKARDPKKGKNKDDKIGRRKDTRGKKNMGGYKKPKNNKNKKKNKNKKTARHPNNLELDEGEDEDEEEVAIDAEEVFHIVKRKAEQVAEIEEEDEDEGVALERQERSHDSVDKEEADDSEVAVFRKKPMAKRSANKNNNNKKGKSNKKNSGTKTSRASVSGIASLTRIGEVSVVDRKNGKELSTEFTIGPVNLNINRTFGRGKDVVVRSASAYSPKLTGNLHLLSVAANGRAKITKFKLIRPSVFITSGSLNFDGSRKGINNFMKKSIGRITPFAAKKLKLAAKYVLKATESNN